MFVAGQPDPIFDARVPFAGAGSGWAGGMMARRAIWGDDDLIAFDVLYGGAGAPGAPAITTNPGNDSPEMLASVAPGAPANTNSAVALVFIALVAWYLLD